MEENKEFQELRSLKIECSCPEVDQEVLDDEDDDVPKEVPEKSNQISDFLFATVLSRFGRVLLSKSQIPQMKKKKSSAAKEMIMHFLVEKGIELTEKQIMKKVNNMKQRIKTKTDKKATGNRKICLNSGEKIIYDLLGAEENPAVAKANYGISVGTDRSVLKERNSCIMTDDGESTSQFLVSAAAKRNSSVNFNTLESSQTDSETSNVLKDKLIPPPPKIRRLKQTNGTKPPKSGSVYENLSTTQLQRMVQIKQLEGLDQQKRVNEKFEMVLDKAGVLLDRYNLE